MEGENRTECVSIDSICPSPENDELYGAINTKSDEMVDLANDVSKNGILEPIVVTQDGVIVSGHRRYAAARMIGMKRVPIRRRLIERSELSELEWKRELRTYNRQREKNTAVCHREAMLDLDPEVAYR